MTEDHTYSSSTPPSYMENPIKTEGIEEPIDCDAIKSENDECDDTTPKKQIRWSYEETLSLIEAYKLFSDTFLYVKKPREVWLIITKYMESKGYNRSWSNTVQRWRYLLKLYYSVKRCKRKRRNGNLHFHYFNEMDDVLKDEPAPSTMEFSDWNSFITSFGGGSRTSKKTVVQVPEEKAKEPQNKPDDKQATSSGYHQWTDIELEALVEAYEIFAPKFACTTNTAKIWGIVADYLQSQGIDYTIEELEKKWSSQLEAYNRVKEQLKRRRKVKSIPFYNRLEAIFNAKPACSKELDDDSCDESTENGESSSRTHRWSAADTEALITAYEMYLKAFGRHTNPNGGSPHVDWTVISKYLKIQSVFSMIDSIKAKWKNLVITYRAISQHMIKTGNGAVRFVFFDRIHKILNEELLETSSESSMDALQINTLRNIKNGELAVHNDSVEEEPVVVHRWSEADTEALINAYEMFCHQFKTALRRKDVWLNIQEHLKANGVHHTCKNVQMKWKNLLRTHKVVTEQMIRTGRNSTRFKFYQRFNKIVNSEDGTANEANVFEEIIVKGDLEDDDKNDGLQRWTVAETETLIQTYGMFSVQFKFAAKRKYVWNDISDYLQSLGFDYSCENIQTKWKNLLKTYRVVKGYMKKSGKRPTRFPYFTMMNSVLGDDLSELDPLRLTNSEGPDDLEDMENNGVEEGGEIIYQRWSRDDTEALINAYELFAKQFRYAKKRKEVWDLITEHLYKQGIVHKCEHVHMKWKNLLRTFKLATEQIKKTGKMPTRFPYFDRMQRIVNKSSSVTPAADPLQIVSSAKGRRKKPVDAEWKVKEPKKMHFWSVDDTELLIDTFVIFSKHFDENKRKKPVWDKIAKYMKQHGVNFSSELIQIKWKNMMRTYKTVKGYMKSGRMPTRFPFLEKLDAVFEADASMALKCDLGDLDEETIPASPEIVDICEDIVSLAGLPGTIMSSRKRTNEEIIDDILLNAKRRKTDDDDEMVDVEIIKLEVVDNCD